MGAEQSASGAPSSEFRVPSSEFRAPRWGGWQQFRVLSKEERKTDQRVASEGGIRGWHPSSEFRVKKKERQIRGWHPRVASEGGIRVPSSEFRLKKKERQIRGWHPKVASEGGIRGWHPSSEFRVKKKERKKDRAEVASFHPLKVCSFC